MFRAPDRAGIISSASVLFLYFFARPDIHWASVLVVTWMWASAMYLDLRITFANSSRIPGHEQSIMLSAVYGRFPARTSWIITMAIEAVCVAALPVIIMHGFDPGASMAVAYLFATLHGFAILSNERFLGSNKAL